MRDLAGRPQSRRRAAGLGAGPVEHAAGVVDAARELDGVTVVDGLLAAGRTEGTVDAARTASEEL